MRFCIVTWATVWAIHWSSSCIAIPRFSTEASEQFCTSVLEGIQQVCTAQWNMDTVIELAAARRVHWRKAWANVHLGPSPAAALHMDFFPLALLQISAVGPRGDCCKYSDCYVPAAPLSLVWGRSLSDSSLLERLKVIKHRGVFISPV